jgi:hypothetical protein
MPSYTLRIQLIGDPDETVYEDLHGRMERDGFLRTVSGVDLKGNQAKFELPHATYFGTSDANVAGVRDWARDHAKAAWGKSIVFEAQTETWALGKS